MLYLDIQRQPEFCCTPKGVTRSGVLDGPANDEIMSRVSPWKSRCPLGKDSQVPDALWAGYRAIQCPTTCFEVPAEAVNRVY